MVILAASLCQYHLPTTLFPAPIVFRQHPGSAQRLPAFGQSLGSKSWAGSWERTTPKHTTAVGTAEQEWCTPVPDYRLLRNNKVKRRLGCD